MENQNAENELLKAETEKVQAETAAIYQSQATAGRFQDRMAAARQKYPDFDAVTSRSDLPVTSVMSQAIIESDIAGEIMYWLSPNPDECRRIASLSDLSAVRELGRIEE